MEQRIKRLERLTAILVQLQSKRIVKAQEIADRFDISLRTVYRDIRALEQAGVPISSEAGYGYSIVTGYNLPPVMFTEEEAHALLMGKKIIERFSDASIRKNHESAMLKIQSILKASEKDQLEILDGQTWIFNKKNIPKNDTENLSVIQKALATKRKLSIEYQSNYKNETTKRTVSAIGITFYSSNWHLIGWCDLRKDYRDFNTQRIKQIVLTNEPSYPSKLISMEEYFHQNQEHEEVYEVVILIKKDVYHFMAIQKYYCGFVEDRETENAFEVRFINGDLEYFARFMLMYSNSVTIVKPQKLIDLTREMVKELVNHYQLL